ncbi:hypothetical protein R50073_06490 [Maricurvus nonylphenolicus]
MTSQAAFKTCAGARSVYEDCLSVVCEFRSAIAPVHVLQPGIGAIRPWVNRINSTNFTERN